MLVGDRPFKPHPACSGPFIYHRRTKRTTVFIVGLITLLTSGTFVWQRTKDHDARSAGDEDQSGCRIDLSAREMPLIDGHWPHERLRNRLLTEGWRENLSRAADGAGSTAFALSRDSVACLFSASWTLADWTDPAPVATEYRFGAGCYRPAADGPSGW